MRSFVMEGIAPVVMPDLIDGIRGDTVLIAELEDVILFLLKLHSPADLKLPHIALTDVVVLHQRINTDGKAYLGKVFRKVAANLARS